MSYGQGNYGYPPFDPTPSQGDKVLTQSGPLGYRDSTGEFTTALTIPPWLEAGASGRFTFTTAHIKDGSISPTGLAITILDGRGHTYVPTGNAAITPGTVTADPQGGNLFYSSVVFGPSVPPGDYVVQWSGTYTPAGSSTAQKIQVRRAFRVQTTKAPGEYYFFETGQG